MGRKLIDLTGQKFGKLSVLSLNEENYNNKEKQIWNCRCDCGNFVTVGSDYLRSKHITPSCGCNKFIDTVVGQTFGDLTVIEEYRNASNRIRYICKCSCGNIVDVERYDLIKGKRTNCGCKKIIERPARIRDLTGQKFGRLTVIKRDLNKYYTKGGVRLYKWVCQCDCGAIISVERGKLLKGHVRSCGCLLADKQKISMDEYYNRYNHRKNNNGEFSDLTGQKFGKLTVVYRDESCKNYTKWVCKCDCGNTISVTRNNLISGHTNSCGCINSVGESFIGMYLSGKGVKYKTQYTFSDCRDAHPLPFDFGILDDNENLIGIIEYDGKQHFEVVRFNGMTQEKAEKSFIDCIKHDNIKNEYCKSKGVPLLRISYTELDNFNIHIDNFLASINALKEAC